MLESAYQESLSTAQRLANIIRGGARLELADAQLELRITVVSFARMLSTEGEKHANRMVCQDAAESMAITIDVISPPRLSPLGISYAVEGRGAPPLIPVRWMVGTRNNAASSARVLMASAGDACPMGGDYRGMLTCDSTAEELPMLRRVLEDSSAKVDHSVQRAFARSPLGHGGSFKLGYLPVLPPADADMHKSGDFSSVELRDPEKHGEAALGPCHSQKCKKKSKFRCGQCKGAYYCSAACQKADWKDRHSTECTGKKATAVRARKALVPFPEEEEEAAAAARSAAAGVGTAAGARAPADERKSVTMPLGNKDAPDNILSSVSWKSGAMYMAKKGEIPANYHKAEFLVKVQVPLMGGAATPLMIYDQQRTFQELCAGDSAAGRELSIMIRQQGVNGIKGYFAARREGDSLRIYTDRIAAPQAW